MPDINLQDYGMSNAEARFMIEYRDFTAKTRLVYRAAQAEKPLMDSRSRPLVQDAFEEIEADYGSVTNYLDQILGTNAADIAKLRSLYLE